MTSLAIIPARSGSKGLPDKNVRSLAGRPLLAWSVQAALDADVFDEVMVSTDSQEYAAAATDAGASVPFLRPPELATDTAKALDVYVHVLSEYAARGRQITEFAVLLPTTPLRTPAHLRETMHRIRGTAEVRGIVSVTELEHPIEWANTLPDDLNMDGFLPERVQRGNRQDFKPHYRPNGAVYASETDYFHQLGGFYGPDTYALIMDHESSIDIDTELDFLMAEFLLLRRNAT